jgi:hypothetical protein
MQCDPELSRADVRMSYRAMHGLELTHVDVRMSYRAMHGPELTRADMRMSYIALHGPELTEPCHGATGQLHDAQVAILSA